MSQCVGYTLIWTNFLYKLLRNQAFYDAKINKLGLGVKPYVTNKIKVAVSGVQTQLNKLERWIKDKMIQVWSPNMSILIEDLVELKEAIKELIVQVVSLPHPLVPSLVDFTMDIDILILNLYTQDPLVWGDVIHMGDMMNDLHPHIMRKKRPKEKRIRKR